MPSDCKHRSAPNTHRHAVDWATAWSGTRAETYNVQATSRIAGARRPRGSRRTRRRRTCRAPGNRTTHDNAHGVESRSNRSVDAQPHGTQRLSTMKLGVAGIRDSDGGGGCWVKLPTSVNLYVAHAASLVMFPPASPRRQATRSSPVKATTIPCGPAHRMLGTPPCMLGTPHGHSTKPSGVTASQRTSAEKSYTRDSSASS